MLPPNETIVWIWKQQSGVQDPGEKNKALNSGSFPGGGQSDID